MTISYASEVPNGSSFGCFWRILIKWVSPLSPRGLTLAYFNMLNECMRFFAVCARRRHWSCQLAGSWQVRPVIGAWSLGKSYFSTPIVCRLQTHRVFSFLDNTIRDRFSLIISWCSICYYKQFAFAKLFIICNRPQLQDLLLLSLRWINYGDSILKYPKPEHAIGLSASGLRDHCKT